MLSEYHHFYRRRKWFKDVYNRSIRLVYYGRRSTQKAFLQTVKYTMGRFEYQTFECKFLWQATNGEYIPSDAYDNIYTIRKPHKKILFPFVKHIYGHYSIEVVDG